MVPLKARSTTSAPVQEVLSIERLVVLPDRVEASVRCDRAHRRTSPQLIDEVLKAFPTIPFHTCRNDAGETFAATMNDTSLPHLLEHMVIDIQTHEQARKSEGEQASDTDDPLARSDRPAFAEAVFTGTTQWSAEDEDVAIVRVSFLDDLIALGAFKKAVHFINTTITDR